MGSSNEWAGRGGNASRQGLYCRRARSVMPILRHMEICDADFRTDDKHLDERTYRYTVFESRQATKKTVVAKKLFIGI